MKNEVSPNNTNAEFPVENPRRWLKMPDRCQECVENDTGKPVSRSRQLNYYPRIHKPAEKVTRHPAYATCNRVKMRAKKKGMDFMLEYDDFINLGPCTYCGGASTGFDRVDSDRGYTKGNVVPACPTCNTMKMRMSVKEFTEHLEKIQNWIKGNSQ